MIFCFRFLTDKVTVLAHPGTDRPTKLDKSQGTDSCVIATIGKFHPVLHFIIAAKFLSSVNPKFVIQLEAECLRH